MDSMNITDEAIAVIGMSCRFPGAPDLDGYWRNLCEGKVSVTFLDRKDLAAAGVDHGLLRGPNYVPAAYSLGDIDKFDAAFFGYAGSEAEKSTRSSAPSWNAPGNRWRTPDIHPCPAAVWKARASAFLQAAASVPIWNMRAAA